MSDAFSEWPRIPCWGWRGLAAESGMRSPADTLQLSVIFPTTETSRSAGSPRPWGHRQRLCAPALTWLPSIVWAHCSGELFLWLDQHWGHVPQLAGCGLQRPKGLPPRHGLCLVEETSDHHLPFVLDACLLPQQLVPRICLLPRGALVSSHGRQCVPCSCADPWLGSAGTWDGHSPAGPPTLERVEWKSPRTR